MIKFDERISAQKRIATELRVSECFDPMWEAERRINFLVNYLRGSGLKTYVLGVSGGVDSTTAGRLVQLAVERLRKNNYCAHFVAMRLPYGVQGDEVYAQEALAFIRPDETITIDIRCSADAMLASLCASGLIFHDDAHEDFVHGNIKARQRMIAQYAVSSARQGLVVGTDHASEAVMGASTKYGDDGADVLPLAGLNKRRVRALARVLGASNELVEKVPTADLERLAPQRPDEEVFGVRYEEIDDFLECKEVENKVFDVVMGFYHRSRHKRRLPFTPFD